MAGTFILKPYERRREAGPLTRFARGVVVVLIASFYGLLCSVLPMQLLMVPAVPILILAAICLWMLPDTEVLYPETMAKAMVWYVGLNAIWPYYVAINLPGLPWVSPQRIAVAVFGVTAMFTLATSRRFRTAINEALLAAPGIRRLFWWFTAVTAFSLLFAYSKLTFTLNKFIYNQIYWTLMFCVTAFLATRPGFVSAISRAAVFGTIVVSCLGLYEFRIKRVFWIDHLPGFLKVDGRLLATFAESQARAGTDIYRVRGTFGVSLYYAEYLAIAYPLVLHAIFRRQPAWHTILLVLGMIAVAANMYLTNARSGVIGLLVALVAYAFMACYRLRRQHPSSIGANAVVFAYPAAVGVLAMLVLFWKRLRNMTLGGGQHQNSSDTRAEQWRQGWPKALRMPFGHGAGRGGDVLGYANRGGEVTIDSYFLNLLLEYGFAGLALFVVLFALTAWVAFRAYLDARDEDREAQLAAPLSVAMLNFTIIKSVLSSEINIPIAFVFAGCVVGLIWQAERRRANPGAPLPATGSDPGAPAW